MATKICAQYRTRLAHRSAKYERYCAAARCAVDSAPSGESQLAPQLWRNRREILQASARALGAPRGKISAL